MEFNIDAAAFKSAKDILPGVIGDKPVLFTAQEGELRIESFDETKEVALTFDANTSGSGSVLFDSKYLPALTAFTGDVGVQVKDKIQFKNPHRKFQVPILPWLGISRQPRVTIGTVTVELADLKELFRKVLFASGRGVVRAYDFSCILLECDSSSMRAVAADTRVIAFAELSKGSSYIGKSKLPRDVVDVIRKFDAPDSMATMTFYEDGHQSRSCRQCPGGVLNPRVSWQVPAIRGLCRGPWKHHADWERSGIHGRAQRLHGH